MASEDLSPDRSQAVGDHSHWPRANGPQLYTEFLQKGASLYCKLHANASSVDQSKYVNYEELADWGWFTSHAAYDNFGDESDTLEALGLSTEDSANPQYWSNHREKIIYEGVTYPATNAQYSNIFNADGGAIIAEMNSGPAHMGASINTLIPLRQYSDVVFLAWQKEAGNRVKGLKYIVRHHIVNEEITAVIKEVLTRRGEEEKPWPGLQISMTERDAWALLGTPNGRGAAWMLIQHKVQLGLKSIRAVTIWKCAPDNFCLCFWLEDLDHDGIDMQAPPDLQNPPAAGSAPTTGGLAKRSAVVPINNTTSSSTSGLGERLMRAMSKRAGDLVKNFWTGLRLF